MEANLIKILTTLAKEGKDGDKVVITFIKKGQLSVSYINKLGQP